MKALMQIQKMSIEAMVEEVYGKGNESVFTDILREPFDAVAFLEWLGKEDAMTDAIYERTENGKYIFPAASDAAKPKAAKIGDQTSKYHQETIAEHTCMVLGGLAGSGADSRTLLAGLLHDVGKKYTSKINKLGGVCFYGHERISAYIAAVILRKMGISKEKAEPIIAAIYAHDHPKLIWTGKRGEKKERAFAQQYGEDAHAIVRAISRFDIGVKENERASDYADLIAAGKEAAVQLQKALEREQMLWTQQEPDNSSGQKGSRSTRSTKAEEKENLTSNEIDLDKAESMFLECINGSGSQEEKPEKGRNVLGNEEKDERSSRDEQETSL